MPYQQEINAFMMGLKERNHHEPEFHQAVQEFVEDVLPFFIEHDMSKQDVFLLERLTEPERIIMFRVSWEDDKGNIRHNKGYRVQFNSAIGPYKGGLRFHPSVNLSVLKFLGFEQIFKNSLTTLPMGGAKGGSDFNPKGKSEREVMRFCQSFMTELQRHIGSYTDIPAGDIGVGAREIGYLFGQYKRIKNHFTGVLTGKGLAYGGSLIRPEATGYGCVYFVREMLQKKGDGYRNKRCIVSGSGNVAQYTVEKLLQLGAKVFTLSDSSGFVYDKNGFDNEKLAWIKDLKNNRRGRIKAYAEAFKGVEFYENERPWGVACDIAFPCATQNEINRSHAELLIKNGCIALGEGANMPSDLDAIHVFRKNKILFAPAKAANAGGVAVSGLEMTQNSTRLQWRREEADEKLQSIMQKIHQQCVEYGQNGDYTDYVKGANIAGFVKVAEASLAYGAV